MAFVDTSFWYARAIARDRRHAEAAALSERLRGELLVTSNLVVGETWTLLSYRAGPRRAIRWLDALHAAPVVVQRVERDVEDEAWAWLRAHDERPYSFVDATSFALMRRLRIREALAFGGDFAAAGFVELRP
ncbi:MAG TPA: PIN domain-containing protein [Gaiellaceae bacterium]|nr:PIN domain-containing protein [Gaiellaceae bacterium]